jgi:hypothetical protein
MMTTIKAVDLPMPLFSVIQTVKPNCRNQSKLG